MKEVYIYVLKCPEGNIRYVGKTINLKKRLYSHILEAKSFKKRRHVLHWIYSLLINNLKPIIEIVEVCNESNWEEKEKYWINYYRNTIPNLCNNAEGGLGGSGKKNYSIQEIEDRAIKARKRFSKFTENEKNKIWELIKLKKSFNYINQIYPSYSRHIHFGVINGRQWNDISKMTKTYGKPRRKGYTFGNGYYIVRNKNRKILFESKDEELVKQFLLNSKTK